MTQVIVEYQNTRFINLHHGHPFQAVQQDIELDILSLQCGWAEEEQLLALADALLLDIALFWVNMISQVIQFEMDQK